MRGSAFKENISPMKPFVFLLLVIMPGVTHAQSRDTISVYFENGISILNSDATKMLDSLAYYNILEPGKRYTVIGYADMVGGEVPNNTLSVNRALAVTRYLAGFGIGVDTAYGAGEIAKPGNVQGYPDDRRVDIIAAKKATLPDIKTLKKGDVFDLENMFFYSGMAIMKPESKPVLESLLIIVKQNPGLKIRIEGHVHCSGYGSNFRQRFSSPTGDTTIDGRRPDYNYRGNDFAELSAARARMVRDYLVKNKIDSTRLQYAGMACKEMNLHPENNRRVSIRILDK